LGVGPQHIVLFSGVGDLLGLPDLGFSQFFGATEPLKLRENVIPVEKQHPGNEEASGQEILVFKPTWNIC